MQREKPRGIKKGRKEDRKRLSLLLLLLFSPASKDDDSDDVQERAKGRVSEMQSSSTLGQLGDISRSSLLLQYSNFFYFSAN